MMWGRRPAVKAARSRGRSVPGSCARTLRLREQWVRSTIPAMSAPLIAVSRLEKTYVTRAGSRIRALADVSLDVADGEFITIVGPSGCAKTTFLPILGVLLP